MNVPTRSMGKIRVDAHASVAPRGATLLIRAATYAALAAGSSAQEEPPSSWGGLESGPHRVGFRSVWQSDAGRTYSATFEDGTEYAEGRKAPRPVLINLWYPALSESNPEPMAHSGYLDVVESAPAPLRPFAQALRNYERRVISELVLTPEEREDEQSAGDALNAWLRRETGCSRDARPANGRFPLVLYHSGSGSSYEDNAVLCEYLASHGYAVLGSAFPIADGSSFNVDGEEGSLADFEFLLRWAARELPFVDWTRVAVAGHSAGAQAALRFAALSNDPIDVVVSIDTTLDYYGLGDPRFRHVTEALLERSSWFGEPVLVIASPSAMFQLIDSLEHAPRTYLTVPILGHDTFISQGVLAAEHRGHPNAAAQRAEYVRVCRFVRHYLDAHLAGASLEYETLFEEAARASLGHEFHAWRMPAGRRGPLRYSKDSERPPTPGQLADLLARTEMDEALDALNRWRPSAAGHPVFEDDFLAFVLLLQLAGHGGDNEVRALHDFYKAIHPEVTERFFSQSELFLTFAEQFGKTEYLEFVEQCLAAARILVPDDERIQRGLERLAALRR